MYKKILILCFILFLGFGFSQVTSGKAEILISSVYDNYRTDKDLKTGWGFASLIKTPQDMILFDTGGDLEKLLLNMQKMEINPDSINKVFISHIHGDHLGGLEGLLDMNNDMTVFIPQSFPNSVNRMILKKGAKLIRIKEPKQISQNIYTTGEIYGPPQEQSLIIESNKGLIIITGCAHPGIVKIIEKSIEIINNNQVYLVLGGFHRPPLSVVSEFRDIGVQKVAPSHCTGDKVRNAFAKDYKKNFIEYGVGKTIRIK